MPFRLLNAPASFQGYINKILAKKLNIFVIIYLDNILIYTENEDQGHDEAVWWVLNLLWKNGLFVNLKKCQFYQDKVRFLKNVVSANGVQIEDKRIKTVKNWPKPKSIKNIQVFLKFANFYQRFIQNFSRIVGPLTSILRTSSTTQSAKNLSQMNVAKDVEVGGGVGGNCKEGTVKRSPSKNLNKAGYLTPNIKKAFNHLRYTFTKASILQHSNPERHI